MDTYIYAFLFCGFVCMISQIILDNTKLTPGHVTSLFVVIGAMNMASENGFIGLALGIFDLTSAGISVAVVSAFFLALIFKPKH